MKKAREYFEYIKYIKKAAKRLCSREYLAVVVCVPVAIIAILICVGTLSSAGKDSPKSSDSTNKHTEDVTERQTYPPSSPYSLEFQTLGDGTCLVSGIGSYRGSELIIPDKSPDGDKVIGIGSRAFEGCGKLVSIEIPEGVVSIGAGAFRGCSSLVLISVDGDNPKFRTLSGMLFSKDKTRIICCPAARIGANLLLDPNVRVIEPYAFDGIINLERILYEKSPFDFEKIEIGEGNEPFKSLPITCNYFPSK